MARGSGKPRTTQAVETSYYTGSGNLVLHRQWKPRTTKAMETSYYTGSGNLVPHRQWKPRTTQVVGNLVSHRQWKTYSYHTGNGKPRTTPATIHSRRPPTIQRAHFVTPVAEDFSHGKCRTVWDGVGQCRAVSASVGQLRTVSSNFGQRWEISENVGQFGTVSGNFGRRREISDSVGQFRAVSGSQHWSRLRESGRHAFPTRETQTTRPVATVLV